VRSDDGRCRRIETVSAFKHSVMSPARGEVSCCRPCSRWASISKISDRVYRCYLHRIAPQDRGLVALIEDAEAGAASGGGREVSLASRRRRFCATAANVSSNCAPFGPRSRRRPRRTMDWRCAPRGTCCYRAPGRSPRPTRFAVPCIAYGGLQWSKPSRPAAERLARSAIK
jgi:hypothetical protein